MVLLALEEIVQILRFRYILRNLNGLCFDCGRPRVGPPGLECSFKPQYQAPAPPPVEQQPAEELMPPPPPPSPQMWTGGLESLDEEAEEEVQLLKVQQGRRRHQAQRKPQGWKHPSFPIRLQWWRQKKSDDADDADDADDDDSMKG